MVTTALSAGPTTATLAAHRPLAAAPPDLPPPATSFPALRETITVLARLDPTLAQDIVRTALPQPTGQLATSLLFFLAAMRGGGINAWLGDRAARQLEAAGKGDLLARLALELAPGDRGTGPQPAANPGGDWRLQPIPIFHGGVIASIQLWLHQPNNPDEDGPSDDRRGSGTRFLIDLELSRIGPLQFDGLVKERRFDLILRSRRSLARSLRQELLGIFAATCETVDLTGRLVFQPGLQNWIRLAACSSTSTKITA